MKNEYKRNRYTFSIGTIGRDMLYTLISMYLMYYLTTVAKLTTTELWWVTGIIVGLRIFDAVNDPFMGMVVDNTHTKWGKHKPWIAVGAFLSGIFTILLFWESGLHGAAFIASFAFFYICWSITYSLNDIAFWSYVPVLSQDLKERENIGAKARIFALIGTFFVVAGIVPITTMIAKAVGSAQLGYFYFAVLVIGVMWLGQMVTLFGVKEPKIVEEEATEKTTFKDFARAIFKNDQLLVVAIAMGLFMIGYTTTTSFGIYYFQYVYGNVDLYMSFAIILGISQIISLLVFPQFAKRFSRKNIYFVSTLLVVAGYILFFFAPTTTMIFVGISGVLIFVGQASIQLLMLLFLADTVDYGHWKLGKRNDSVTFSLQPFIYKAGGAAASGIVGVTIILAGLHNPKDGLILAGENLLIFKISMFVLPIFCILLGYLIYHQRYKITEEKYKKIHQELVERCEIVEENLVKK